MLSQRWNPFRVCSCSASNEIHSAYAQPTMKFVPRILSVQLNSFRVCSAWIVHVKMFTFFRWLSMTKMTQKSLIKMQISPIKNPNFEKPSRNLSNRTKVKILKKFGSVYAQSPRKCSNIEILAKIEGKEAKKISKIYKGHIRIWFRSKKNSKLSHACVPLKRIDLTILGCFCNELARFM